MIIASYVFTYFLRVCFLAHPEYGSRVSKKYFSMIQLFFIAVMLLIDQVLLASTPSHF